MRKRDQRPPVAAPPLWRFGQPETIWLDNGLQVVFCPRKGQHVASVCLSLDVPLSAEPAGLEGLATITGRCLDEGTLAHPGAAFAESLEDIGAALDGSVGHAATQVCLDAPVAVLPEALKLLAEAVRTPQLDAAEIQRHQELRLAEIEQLLASSAHSAQMAFRKACIPSRYRAAHQAGGNAASVSAITAAEVHRFHAQQYRPDVATLIISGDLDDSALDAVDDAFGDWDADEPRCPLHQHPVPRSRHQWLVDRAGAVQTDIRLGAFGIDRTDPRWADIQVATHALGGAFLSRLNRVLREERGFTYGVHLVNQPMRSGGLIAVQGSFRTETVPEALTLAASLVDLTTRPITQEEVAEAVRYITGSAPLRFATAQGVTQHLAALVAAGLSADFIDANSVALSQVTPTSATEALASLLPADRLSLVVVGPADQLRVPLADAGWVTSDHQL
jgi:zinc protease